MYEINLAKSQSQTCVHFVTDLASAWTDHRMSGLPNRDNQWAYFWSFSNWCKLLLFELMIIQARTWKLCTVAPSFFVCLFAVFLNAFLSMSFHVVRPRNRLCVRFFPLWQFFSVAPEEIRNSNISLCCSIMISFGLHPRWVHPKKKMVKKWCWFV